MKMLGILINLLDIIDQAADDKIIRSAVGILRDLFTKLNGKDADVWWDGLKKFLRKEPCWTSATDTTTKAAESVKKAEGTIVSYIVDCTISLEEMISAGHYDWVNKSIDKRCFPIRNTGKEEWEFKVFDFDCYVSSESAVSRIENDDKNNPWQPAAIEHLLTYGARNPDEQRTFEIIALGSVGEVSGYHSVPYLGQCRYTLKRDFGLHFWVDDWNSHYRFLAVRRKKVVPVAVS
jgi:hypothetical protein